VSDRHQTPQEPEDEAGDELLRRLGAALDASDQLPPGTATVARELLRWRSDDADLALLGLAEAAPVRSGSTLQIHRFSTDDVDVELVVDGTTVSGVIEPWPLDEAVEADWRVTIERLDAQPGGVGPGAGHTVEVDDDGEFDVELEGGGPIRVVISSSARRVRTEWVLTG
jgi:hypothetical protein